MKEKGDKSFMLIGDSRRGGKENPTLIVPPRQNEGEKGKGVFPITTEGQNWERGRRIVVLRIAASVQGKGGKRILVAVWLGGGGGVFLGLGGGGGFFWGGGGGGGGFFLLGGGGCFFFGGGFVFWGGGGGFFFFGVGGGGWFVVFGVWGGGGGVGMFFCCRTTPLTALYLLVSS